MAVVQTVVAAAASALLVVDAWTGAISRPDPVETVAIGAAVARFLRKRNVRRDAGPE